MILKIMGCFLSLQLCIPINEQSADLMSLADILNDALLMNGITFNRYRPGSFNSRT